MTEQMQTCDTVCPKGNIYFGWFVPLRRNPLPMRYLSIVFVALFLVACHKEEDSQPKAAQTPRPMAPFSCSDSSDDGKIEVWDDTVKALIFGTGDYIRDPDTLTPGYLLSMDSFSQTISMSKPDIYFRAVFDTGSQWILFFDVVDAARGLPEASGGIDITSHKTVPDTVASTVTLFPAYAIGLTAGCKRVYYWGIKDEPDPNSTHVNLETLRGAVLFKGHYDVQVN
jgi:hypothetical protein